MEIERKFLVESLPENLEDFPSQQIEQAYLCTAPVVRVRRHGDAFYLTYKGAGLMVREEYNLPLTEKAYLHLVEKADGARVAKRRFCIPFGEYTVELDVFEPPFVPLVMAEVEFETEQQAKDFCPPSWFGREVTLESGFTNAALSKKGYWNPDE